MRVSVLGELSGAIAHEVNQPLTAILSNAQAALYLLAQENPNLAEIRDALQDIVQEDNRAGEVVRRLRGLLKKGETRSEPIDINELVESTTALLRSELIGRRIVVETDLADRSACRDGRPRPVAAGSAQSRHERDGCDGFDPGGPAACDDHDPRDAGPEPSRFS